MSKLLTTGGLTDCKYRCRACSNPFSPSRQIHDIPSPRPSNPPLPRLHPFTRTQNIRGHTPLHFAYAYGYEELGEYLVKKGGADANIRNVYGLTCFEGLGIKTPLTGGHR